MDGKEMTGRELDAAVAKVMGWRWVLTDDHPCCVFMSPVDQQKSGGRILDGPTDSVGLGLSDVPAYSTDHAAAYEMEAELERRGMASKYADNLYEIVADEKVDDWRWNQSADMYFAIAHASPLNRCRAALAVTEGKDGE